MSVSVIKRKNVRNPGHTALAYLIVSIVCAMMGAVYEMFSHEVYSYFMIYAFAFPLIGGALPFLLLAIYGKGRHPRRTARRLYHSGIAALTVGSFVEGVLRIYGTTSRLMVVYWMVGAIFVGASILSWLTFRPAEKHE